MHRADSRSEIRRRTAFFGRLPPNNKTCASLPLERFADGGVPFFIGSWLAETNEQLYSIWVHVPHTMGVIEIVTRRVPARFASAVAPLDHVRLPNSALAHAGVNLTVPAHHDRSLRPVAISKVTSDMGAIARYYRGVMHADEMHYAQANNTHGRLFHLREGNVAIRFVESDNPMVAYFEAVKMGAHNGSFLDYSCGTDRYYDNHYAYSPPTNLANMSIGALASRARDLQYRWHCEQNGVYFWEPTGDTIYIARTLNTTIETDAAARREHDPEVVEELETCARHGKSQSQLCGQGYCAGTALSHTDLHLC